MNTGLGLSFLRVVNEEGLNGWAQIYARVPFDDSELQTKGALFGVIFGGNKDDWAEKDSELMGWVEEYFNGIEVGGDLADFFKSWKDKYQDLDGVWIWILEKAGRREIMMARLGHTGIALIRDGKEFDFSASMAEEKVAKGVVNEGDRVVVWTEGLQDKTGETKLTQLGEVEASKLNETLKNQEFAGAGLILDFKKMVEEVTVEPAKEDLIVVTPRRVVEETPARHEEEVAQTPLARETYVGQLGFKEKLINAWLKITRLRKSTNEEGFVARKDNSKRKKWAVTLGLIFLGLLLVSLVTGSIKIKNEAELKKWKEFSEPIEKSLSEAQGLSQLNPSGAKKLVADSKSVYDTKKGEFEKGKYSKEVEILGKKIDGSWTAVSGEKESQIEEVARIDLVRQGFKGDRMAWIKDRQLSVLDSTMGVVVVAELATKDIKVIAGKGEGLGWVDVAGDASKMMVLNSSGIRDSVSGQDLVKFDAAVVKPIAMGRFGGNIYLLDQGNKELFKYAAVGEGFGERARWLKQDQVLGGVPVDMAIDSDIWSVTESGQVEKFRRGSKEQFSLSGLANGLKISRVAIEQDGDKLALLDNSSGVVAICSKDTGVCSQLLKAEKLREVKDIEFDAQGNLLVLLPGVIGVLK